MADSSSGESSDRTLVDVLSALSRGSTRYDGEGEFARGGMGAIHRVWDRDLRRPLAMKVYLGEVEGAEDASRDSSVDPRVARFVEEAQITGQLDHPGIVPVHELGLDDEGRLFFTMKLVQGHTLADVLPLARRGEEGWGATRFLRALVRICEAVAYAHARGVVHRDLKPANIMVGQFGEVYVMDWGLAKVIGADERDLGPAPEPSPRTGASASASSTVRTDRVEAASTAPESHLLTLEGNVLGTPSYMPLEQAQGRIHDVGPRADVYALGAILYEFLTGRAPYASGPGEDGTSAHEVLIAALEGPPVSVRELAPEAPAELVTICERAMARDAGERFPDALALADALGTFFERPVDDARRGLQGSRLAAAIQWTLGVGFWLLAAGLVLACLVVAKSEEGGLVSLSLPVTFDVEDPSYSLTSERAWVASAEIRQVQGNLVLNSSHWVAKAATVVIVAVVISFLMFVLHQSRRILRNVRRGEPFALENMRSMRRIGAAILIVGVLQVAQSPLMGSFAEKYLELEGLVIRRELDMPWLELLGGAAILVLAEVFRVGAELERQRG